MALIGRLGIDEDYAMKERISGFYVTNYADGRQIPIQTYFRFPDPEERDRAFPHFAIDLTSMEFDRERAHRAVQWIEPNTETATPSTGFFLMGDDMPLPWTLMYQVATYARQPWHDRQLMQIMYQLFPETFGSLTVTADGTVRRADLVSAVRRDTVDANKKRLYRNIYTIAVSTEFFANQLQYIQEVTNTNLDLVPYLGASVNGTAINGFGG